MFSYEERLSSFIEWPAAFKPEFISKLAVAGHYSVDPSELTTACAFCGHVLEGWEISDCPMAEHLAHDAYKCILFSLNTVTSRRLLYECHERRQIVEDINKNSDGSEGSNTNENTNENNNNNIIADINGTNKKANKKTNKKYNITNKKANITYKDNNKMSPDLRNKLANSFIRYDIKKGVSFIFCMICGRTDDYINNKVCGNNEPHSNNNAHSNIGTFTPHNHPKYIQKVTINSINNRNNFYIKLLYGDYNMAISNMLDMSIKIPYKYIDIIRDCIINSMNMGKFIPYESASIVLKEGMNILFKEFEDDIKCIESEKFKEIENKI